MKQVILVRNDLKMPRGKLSVMVAHASVDAANSTTKAKFDEWRRKGMKKIVLKVEDLKALLKYENLANKSNIKTSLITDAGKTVFTEPTITCLAIGPDSEEKIDKITGKLKILL